MSKTIAVIPGDGIGPEIMNATLRVLDALDTGLSYDVVEAGMVALDKHGDLLPAATLEAIAKHKVALKGPCSTPIGEGFTSVNVGLRKKLNLFAAVRPVRNLEGVDTRFTGVDLKVHSMGHRHSYSGRAWVPSLVPPGINIDALLN